MIDFNVCYAGFAAGLFIGVVASLLNTIITSAFRWMRGES